YSENGNGIGYNYISIRGFDQRRISVSVNGIPQNEPEDHNVYWLDFPDLLASTDYIQVQRGAGSGVFGYPAIGGSINIITSNFSNQHKLEFSAMAGSYNTRKYAASFSSGLIDGKYSFYTNISKTLSDGYRDNAWTNYSSYYVSAVRYDDKLTTQVNFYGGPIEDGLAYNGLPKQVIGDENRRKENLSSWEFNNGQYVYSTKRRTEEVESFSQPHYELLNEYKISNNVIFNSALFLVTGKGYFDYDGSWGDSSYFRLTSNNGFSLVSNPYNSLIRAQVENKQYGWLPRISIAHTDGILILGAEYRNHRSYHWGSIIYADSLPAPVSKDYKYYEYNGAKDIISFFAHEDYQLNKKVNLMGELQIVYNKYRIYKEKYVNNDITIKNTFFNPRLGINYKLNENNSYFISFARVSREPRLKNYYDAAESSGGSVPQFGTNSDGTYDFSNPLVKPETMNDFEGGTNFTLNNLTVTVNAYYMLFKDEIVKNGKLDRFGQPITGNADQSIHRGLELSVLYKMPYGFTLNSNVSYSNNFINKGKYYLDTASYIDLSKNKIGGFPELIFNLGLNYTDNNFYAQVNAKYTGKFYSDNYDKKLSEYKQKFGNFVTYDDNVNDGYFTADLTVSYSFNYLNSAQPSKIFIQVNNVFNKLYSAFAVGQEFFPGAERNFIAGVKISL
ncbi:MAG: TonB-dependent receptor, partial [Bacteroidota bacterium]|nr:TonB-dependent receptor [Bacteroidota bacterium]